MRLTLPCQETYCIWCWFHHIFVSSITNAGITYILGTMFAMLASLVVCDTGLCHMGKWLWWWVAQSVTQFYYQFPYRPHHSFHYCYPSDFHTFLHSQDKTCRQYCCHVQMRLDLFNSKIDCIAPPSLVLVGVAYETFLALAQTVLNYFCTMSGMLCCTLPNLRFYRIEAWRWRLSWWLLKPAVQASVTDTYDASEIFREFGQVDSS